MGSPPPLLRAEAEQHNRRVHAGKGWALAAEHAKVAARRGRHGSKTACMRQPMQRNAQEQRGACSMNVRACAWRGNGTCMIQGSWDVILEKHRPFGFCNNCSCAAAQHTLDFSCLFVAAHACGSSGHCAGVTGKHGGLSPNPNSNPRHRRWHMNKVPAA